MTTGQSKRQIVLYVEAQKDFRPQIEKWIAGLTHFELLPSPDLLSLAENPPADPKPALILVDGRQDATQTKEWAQTLKMALPAPMIVFYDGSTQLDFGELRKNGADSLMHFYYDSEFVVDKILELAPWTDEGPPPLGVLNPIAFEDLSSEMDLNFDLYVHLPGNQKSVLVRRKGAPLEVRLIEKAKESHQNLYFKKNELKQFLEYSRTALSLKESHLSMSVTDKIMKARVRIQQIISHFFSQDANDFAGGKIIFENCADTLKEFGIPDWKTKEEVKEALVLFSGRPRSYYNDTIAMCVLSAGFGYLLNRPSADIHDLGLAGLLHNIGLALMKSPVLLPQIDELDEATRKEYILYPEWSVNQVKGKRVPLSPRVTSLILEHREKAHGGGFPKGTSSDLHDELSKVIQVAFRVMEMTQLQKDRPRFTFQGALQHLQNDLMKGTADFDTSTILELQKTFKN